MLPPLHINISVHRMSCAGNATNSEKFRKIKTLNILAFFRQILQEFHVASLNFLQRSSESSENCITITSEKIALEAGED